MVLDVRAIINNEAQNLQKEGNNTYTGSMTVPEQQIKTVQDEVIYPVSVIVVDDAGNQTVDNSTFLKVISSFNFDVIIAGADGSEISIIDVTKNLDIDVSSESKNDGKDSKNTFELNLDNAFWDADTYNYWNRIYIPNTEYGGLIGTIRSVTSSNTVYISGQTWRGILNNRVLEPPVGETHLILNGELHEVLRGLIADEFDDIFFISDAQTEVVVSGWKVERYASIYQTIVKLLGYFGMKLCIRYDQEQKAVELSAVPIIDYSSELEYSQDSKVNFDIKDYRAGVNHIICAGSGAGSDRLILHLYVQEDGSIGSVPYFTGLRKIDYFYDYKNVQDVAELYEAGVKKLKELQNYKSFSMSVENVDLEIGDIVGGREYVTGMELRQPVIQKIFKKDSDGISIQYKLKGES